MNRSFLLALGAAFLGSTAAAQGPTLTFDINAFQSQFTYSGSTSLGPIVGNPNTFGLSGTVEARLGAGLTGPIGTIQFVPGSSAAVSPDIDAVIPNPFVFLPPLAQITITGLILGLESGPIAVDPTGSFSGTVVATIQAGIVTITPLGSAPTITDLAGNQTDPQMVSGVVTASNSIVGFGVPLNLPFMLMDPATGLTATVNLMGDLEANHTFPQPSSYCTAVPNSTGISAAIGTTGTPSLSSGSLGLTASALPQNSLGYFLFSADQGFVPTFGGSAGNLCLGGQLYRLSNFVLSSGGAGQVALPLPFGGLPPGLTADIGIEWNFQYWFRDQNGGVPTSNTTDGITVVFTP
ncbi:MAG: hypothetical protein ACJAZN_002884 [Planctomycetota bacterium]|jgi:hypothetical protein